MNRLSISLVTGGPAGGLDTSREDDKLCQSCWLPKSFSQKLQEVIGQKQNASLIVSWCSLAVVFYAFGSFRCVLPSEIAAGCKAI